MYITYLDSPIGIIQITANEVGITGVDFVDVKGVRNENELVLECKKQLEEYFNKKRKIFTVKLALSGTQFQNSVWQALQRIPYGNTVTYKDIALSIGEKKSYRAVGNANNKNKIAIIIPCHRVIGSNGKLIGYAGGLDKKTWLLNHEIEAINI